jgi:hypothetical protein
MRRCHPCEGRKEMNERVAIDANGRKYVTHEPEPKMRSEELDIDKIIDANMTVTDHLLRDAIRGVVIDAMNKAAERAEIMANLRLNGWRQCAVGQKTTQFCGMLEAAVQAEREACAKLCEEIARRNDAEGSDVDWVTGNMECADAIRARGESK